ncbi:sphingosine-1-phosphate lyase [Lycorma delicatula]|uniref:sphingosine-1-phosphate lyase n=1 Tax=Lycorma delicatula TaxID=130591 RepID=UPI003F51981A
MDSIEFGLKAVKLSVNGCLSNKEPWQIVTMTATSVLIATWIWQFLFNHEKDLKDRSKQFVFSLVKKLPWVARELDKELKKINCEFENDIIKRNKGRPYITELPKNSLTSEEILILVKDYVSLGDYDWKKGYVSGTVYCNNEELINLMTQVYGIASYTNPLHSDVFPGVCKMEAEVVRICANLFNGGPNACGTMTTGGTESILMACKAYRDYAKYVKGINYPEIVLPITAHPAFDKAASYFKMRIVHVAIDPVTTAVDIKLMKRAISQNTCMLVGSKPNYPYGTADDIEGIAALGLKYNIPVHVDCCLGGFLTAFMPAAGFNIRPYDFSLQGVTSISADTHKYGFAPKGSSVILYSDFKYRLHQFCVTTDWPGGVYGSPTVNGSRAGGIIAACWATLMYFGIDGYVEATSRIIKTTKFIETELRKIDGIFIFGKPETSVIAIGSNKFHIYLLSEALGKKGWNLNPLQFPVGIHICITNMHSEPGVAEMFVNDVNECVNEILKNPNDKDMGKMAIYGMAQSIPDRTVVSDFTRLFISSNYYTPSSQQQSQSSADMNEDSSIKIKTSSANGFYRRLP